MAEKKNQHYVPQFHLKNFSINGGRKIIGLFNIPSNKFIGNKARIKHQCAGDWFYGKDLILENALEYVETLTSSILKKIINSSYFPPRFSEEHRVLISFVCLLSARTKYNEEATNDSIDGFLKHIMSFANEFTDDKKYTKEVLDKFKIRAKNAIHLSLETAIEITPLLNDLKYVLLLNETSLSFWTSDNPVVFYNQLLSTGQKRIDI